MWKFSNYIAGWQASICGALCVWGMGEDACLQYCHCLGTYSSEQQANLILWNPGCHGRTQGEMSALAWVLIFFLMLVLNCLTQLAPGLLAYKRDQLRWRIKGLTSSSINSFSPRHWASLVVNSSYFEGRFHTDFVLCFAGCWVTDKI